MKISKIFLFALLMTSNARAIFDYDRAIAQGQKGQWHKAQEIINTVLVKNPDRPDALYDAGISAYKNAHYDKALSYFQAAADRCNSNIALQEQAYFNAGNAHVQLKQLEQAIHSYDAALKIDPDNKRTLHNKEVVKKMLEQQKKQEEQKKEQDQKENKDPQQKKDSDKKDQDKPHNKDEQNKDKGNDQQDQDSKKSKGQEQQKDSNQSSKEQSQNKQQEESKKQEQKETGPEKNPKDSAGPDAQQQEHASQKKSPLSGALAHLLDEHEKKDAQLNKKLMKAMSATQGGSADANNCW